MRFHIKKQSGITYNLRVVVGSGRKAHLASSEGVFRLYTLCGLSDASSPNWKIAPAEWSECSNCKRLLK